jgi:hypothetical protein
LDGGDAIDDDRDKIRGGECCGICAYWLEAREFDGDPRLK